MLKKTLCTAGYSGSPAGVPQVSLHALPYMGPLWSMMNIVHDHSWTFMNFILNPTGTGTCKFMIIHNLSSQSSWNVMNILEFKTGHLLFMDYSWTFMKHQGLKWTFKNCPFMIIYELSWIYFLNLHEFLWTKCWWNFMNSNEQGVHKISPSKFMNVQGFKTGHLLFMFFHELSWTESWTLEDIHEQYSWIFMNFSWTFMNNSFSLRQGSLLQL